MCCSVMRVDRFLGLVILALSLMVMSESGSAQGIDKEKLVLGIFPYMSGIRIVKLYQPMADYLGRKLNKNIVIVSAPSFKDFVSRTDAQQYDLLFTAPHFALRAEIRNEYERMFRFKNDLTGVIFVSAKSPIDSLVALMGKTIAFPDKLAVVSALGEVYFKRQGISVNIADLPSHNNVILAVLNDQYDAGLAAKPVVSAYNRANPGKLKLLAETESISGAMFMVKGSLGSDLKSKIMQDLSGFDNSNEGKEFFEQAPFAGLIPVTEEEMNSMKSYLDIVEKYL